MLKSIKFILISIIFLLSSCSFSETVINQRSEALLTKNNELQFRFHINENTFQNVNMYKVRITVNNKKLAKALGKDEIIYGEESVHKGEYLNVHKNKKHFVVMKPIPLRQDLHTFELQKLIKDKKAITVEVFNEEKVLGKGILSNFSTQF